MRTMFLVAMMVFSPLALAAESDWKEVESGVRKSEAMGWMALSERGWGQRAEDLHAQYRKVMTLPEAERDAHLPVLFDLLLELGRAAENANDASPPHYLQVGPKMVNMAWYQAGSLLFAHPELGEGRSGAVFENALFYRGAIERAELPAKAPWKD